MLDAAPRVFFKIDLLFICNLSRDTTFSCVDMRDMKLKQEAFQMHLLEQATQTDLPMEGFQLPRVNDVNASICYLDRYTNTANRSKLCFQAAAFKFFCSSMDFSFLEGSMRQISALRCSSWLKTSTPQSVAKLERLPAW